MRGVLFPDIFKDHVTAFFTGKDPGADTDKISRILKINKENIYMPVQQHTDKVLLVGPSPEPTIADAVITKEKGILIGVRTADCAPVLIYEKESGVIGVVHAGWRGTAAGILRKTVQSIMDRFICGPENFLIAIGPCIKSCCYTVDSDVVRAVRRETGEGEYYMLKEGKHRLDLPSANKYQALSLGVPESNIRVYDECTFCHPDRYYSYRYSKGITGRQGGFIGKI
ncbi:MAG: peptidoglycan editing factor PgeF [Nitrospirota bacterium]|nr:peptidoglycan editing factor PgeF [Nitrospirota bacterium]